jgi:hypothetical protein
MNSIDEELIDAARECEVAQEENLAEIRRLLTAGADVNAKDDYNWTLLASTRAQILGPFGCCKELLKWS